MKLKSLIKSMTAGALSTLLAGPVLAAPVMVAGWDFSQYAFDGFLSLNGADLTGGETLSANYSDRDLTNGAGTESANFGRMYLNGQFGSTTTPLDFTDWFVPSAAAPGSLSSNISPGIATFDSWTTLVSEGQEFTNPFAMTALQAATVVFGATLAPTNEVGTNWTVAFAAKTSVGTAQVQVQLSLDGVNFVSAGIANLTTTDTAFTFAFTPGGSETAYARLVFADPAVGQNTFLDNLSLTAASVAVPEPGTAVLLLAGLAGLARMGRRRA